MILELNSPACERVDFSARACCCDFLIHAIEMSQNGTENNFPILMLFIRLYTCKICFLLFAHSYLINFIAVNFDFFLGGDVNSEITTANSVYNCFIAMSHPQCP